MAFTGTVARLTRYMEKGILGETLQNAVLISGLGMEGDFHAGGSRQISLLSLEARKWMDTQAGPGLCFRRYKENILFEGLPFFALTAGAKLRIGETVLQISSLDKDCFDECLLFSRGQRCILAGQNLFAGVITGGIIRIGDTIEIATV